MPTSTTNYGLIKPGTDDPILIGQLNDNMDTIDAALKENTDAIESKPDAADIPTPSTAAPAMDGTAAAGTSTDYARSDHVHPSDTSKQDTLNAAQLAAVNSGINSTKVEQIETNKNNILSLSPTAYTAPRPNKNYNITIESGGYFVCGKICFINVRLNVGTDIPNNTYFLYDLPEALTPLTAGSSICTLTNNRGVYISVASQGNLLNASGAAITAGQLLLNGAYLIK